MSDKPKTGARSFAEDPVAEVRSGPAAVRVASVSRDAPSLDMEVLTRLEEALLGPDPDDCRAVVEDLVEDGLPRTMIADRYVPELARRMGVQWCEDGMSFAAVTIGMSRLQRLLRGLGPEFVADGEIGRDEKAILLLVPEVEQHTLGAILLSGQLRRMGFSVRLCLGYRPGDARYTLAQGKYDAVLVSAAYSQHLELLRDVVKSVRQVAPADVPICVGGPTARLVREVGHGLNATYVTDEIDEALKLCGLTPRSETVAPGASRT